MTILAKNKEECEDYTAICEAITMSTLQFKGKSAVWNHHLSVPYHTLEKDAKKSLKGTDAEENLIIEGDNLLALKSLLPKYQGRIKCIYIDPPYNTGNENWVYSDNVNSPTIREWIGKTVGKDDLTRHDKWLCMMTPRLKLLRELLTEDGVIFISIDDNEVGHLKILMDDIFGEGRFITNFIWKKKGTSTNVTGTQVSELTDYVLAYGRTEKATLHPRVRSKETREYPLSDDEGSYRLAIVEKKNAGSYQRESMRFSILGVRPREGKRWQIGEDKAHEFERKKRFVVQNGVIKLKIYDFEDRDTLSAQPNLLDEHGTTDSAARMLADLFGKQEIFENPKPIELISHLVAITTDKNSIILDSFAGSGTTAHSVLDLNEEDAGNRKFILVEMENYANSITAERVRRVIKRGKYKNGFTYSTLGLAIDAESILTGKLPTYKEFAKYVYYLATGKNHPDEKKIKEDDSFVGKTDLPARGAQAGHQSVYLIYEKNADALKKLAITLDWAEKSHKKDSNKKIVYAPACYLDDEALERFNIKFVSIPYNLFERQ